jgi:hypothetical protein
MPIRPALALAALLTVAPWPGSPSGPVALQAAQALTAAIIEANEAFVVASLRSIVSAQAVFSALCGDGDYAADLAGLARPSEPGGAGFLPADLANGPRERRGYRLTFVAGAPVGGTRVGCNGARLARTYFVSAAPVTPGETGRRFFAVNTEGVLFQSTAAIAVTQAGTPKGATPVP